MTRLTKNDVRKVLRGHVIVPMITPLLADRTLDVRSARRLADHILHGGCDGLMLAGTNGEGPSMTERQRIELVTAVAPHVGDKGNVFVGIGATSWADAVSVARAGFKAGAVAAVAHPPPFFPIGAGELERYFIDLADAIGGPLFLYNMPSTTRISIPLDVIDRLSRHPLILGIKDSEGDGDRQEALARAHANRADFTVFCGSIPFSLRALKAGADGNVPSLGNLAPAVSRALVDSILRGDANAGAVQERSNALAGIYQKGRTLPQQIAALKACAAALKLCERHVLPPLIAANDADVVELGAQLTANGLSA